MAAASETKYTVTSTWEIRIDKEADIVEVRQRVRELAKEHRFDQFAVAALTTAASELSRNVWVHAKKGTARIDVLQSGNSRRIDIPSVHRLDHLKLKSTF